MPGRKTFAFGLASRILACYVICGISAGILLAATAILSTAESNSGTAIGWAPLTGLASLMFFALGGWLIARRLASIGNVEAQLYDVNATGLPADLSSLPVRNGASLGWNRLVEQIKHLESSGSLADRLEAALAAHGDSNIEGAIQSISDGLAVTDMEGRISFANQALAALLSDGSDDDQLEQACIFDLLAGDTNADGDSLFDTTAMRTVVGELSPTSGDKGRLLRAARHPVKTNEQTTGFVWSIRDVTQQRLADKMRDQFLDSATHELRTPLANIKAYAETLAMDDMIDVECQKDFCNTINAEATRLARLIDDLLDLSSMEVGSLSIARQNVELDRLLREAVDKVAPLMEKKNLEFEVVLPEKLPEMQLDKDKVATMLVNLLGNAAKYTPPKGRVSLRVKLSKRDVQINVEDTGVGIPASDLPHVFDKFFRGADHRVQSEAGTGLGLSIAREIARLHGGDIEVHSEVDSGSTFSLTLPLQMGA